MDKFLIDIRKQMALDELKFKEQLLSLTLQEDAVSLSLAQTRKQLQQNGGK
jgi:hypothetical protein